MRIGPDHRFQNPPAGLSVQGRPNARSHSLRCGGYRTNTKHGLNENCGLGAKEAGLHALETEGEIIPDEKKV